MAEAAVVTSQPDTSAQPAVGELDESRWLLVSRLPCRLTVELPVPGFRLGDLLKLSSGHLAATACHVSQDLPLRINGTLIGWGEFESVAQHLAIRITQLA